MKLQFQNEFLEAGEWVTLETITAQITAQSLFDLPLILDEQQKSLIKDLDLMMYKDKK